MEEIRSGYKAFLDSPTGKDFLTMLLTKEATAQMEGKKAETAELKAFAMVMMNTVYDIRTYLADMSQPSKQSKKPVGPQMRSAGPQA